MARKNLHSTRTLLKRACQCLDAMEGRILISPWPSRTWACFPHRTEPVSPDDQFHLPGITCWFAVIPTHPADPSQYDNSHGGSGFMLEALDFYGHGDNRIAVFDWTGLKILTVRTARPALVFNSAVSYSPVSIFLFFPRR